MKRLFIAASLFFAVLFAGGYLFSYHISGAALSILTGQGGGTGFGTTTAGNISKCLSVSSINPLIYTFSACSGGSGGASYPFPLTTPSPGNATSTLTQFNGGLTAFASSTIGDNTSTGGLTVIGSATTTNLTVTALGASAGQCLTTTSAGLLTTTTCGTTGSGYPFPNNATTTQIAFNGGLTAVGATTTALAVTGSTTISSILNVGGAINAGSDLTVLGNTSLQKATTTSLAITSLVSKLLSTNANGSVIGTTVTTPLQFSANALSIQQATGAQDGYLSLTDWGTFNGKLGSTSLNASYPLAYNSSTGAFTFSGLATSSTWTAGQVAYVQNNNTVTSVATSTVTISTGLSYSGTSPFNVIGGTSGNLTATLGTNITPNELNNAGSSNSLIYTNSDGTLFRSVATSTLTFTGFPANIPATYGNLVGGSNTTFTYWGLATTSQPSSSNLLTSNGAAGVYGTATTTLSVTGNGSLSATTVIVGSTPITLNIPGDSASYPFSVTTPTPGNATSTLTQFNGGITAFASSTIGNGTAGGGLTVFGNSTTTGTAYFAGSVGIGTTTPAKLFHVYGTQAGGIARFERRTAGVASTIFGTQDVAFSNTGVDTNLTGPAQTFSYISSVGVVSTIGDIGAQTNGANNTGLFFIRPYGAGSPISAFYVTPNSAGAIGIATSTPIGMLNISTYSNSSKPQLIISDQNGGANLKHWYASTTPTTGNLAFGTINDAFAVATPVMTLTRGGSVGIGTTSPTSANMTLSSASQPQLNLTDTSATSDQWIVRNSGGVLNISTSSPLTYATSTPSAVTFQSSATTLFGIATSTPWRTLSVNGTVGFAGLTTASAAQSGYLCLSVNNEVVNDSTTCLVSALKFKKDIQNLDVGLDDLLKLRPVSYYKKDPLDITDSHRQMGFVADEVAAISPALNEMLVTYDSEGKVHAFRYEQFTALLTKSIQELNAKVISVQRSVEENWQWGAMALMALGMCFMYYRIKRLENEIFR